jgi:hypothetical protein
LERRRRRRRSSKGERRGATPVVAEESVKIEVREYVTVHCDERAVETLDETKWRGRAERLRLARVFDLDGIVRAVAKNCLDQVRQIADAQRDVRDPTRSELAEDELQNGAIAYRHQRLR